MSKIMPSMPQQPPEVNTFVMQRIWPLINALPHVERLEVLSVHLIKRSYWLFYLSHSKEGPEFWLPHATIFVDSGAVPRAKWQIPLYDLFTLWGKWNFCNGSDIDIIYPDLFELEKKHEYGKYPKLRRWRRRRRRRRPDPTH